MTRLPDTGSAIVFESPDDSTDWRNRADLRLDSPVQSQFFGQSVALDGDTIVVGAPGNSSHEPGFGSVHVFWLDERRWIHQAELKAPGTIQFGETVGLSGGTIVVGAPGSRDSTAIALGSRSFMCGGG